ncbi:8500_t:CDS:2 [Rhizophagus irregularis]|nr:8500_t:CDS:2 [Rhizophagus irregularis]
MLVKGVLDNGCLNLVKLAGKSQIHEIKDLYTEEQTSKQNRSDDVFEIDLEDVLVDATSDDNAKVIPTNGGEKQKLVSILYNIHSSRLKISNFVLSIKVTIGRSRKIKKSLKNDQLKKVFPVNTLPPNLRDRSPPPSYKSGDNSLDDHNEASPVIFSFILFAARCVKFVSNLHCSSKSNDRDESDIGID